MYPATPGWGVRCGCGCLGSGFGCAPPPLARVLGCACLCACSRCTPPLLAGVCGVRVCYWVRVSAAPRHSWLGCWGVCVLVCALRSSPATPGWGVRCGYVCLGYSLGCAPPLLARVLGCVCAGVHALLVPPQSWLGCAAWVSVFVLGFRLRSATPGWGVGVCVCWCPRSACTPPLLAGLCGLGVCVWARVSAAPRHSWLGCWAYVCAGVRTPLVPRHSCLGCAAWVCVFGLGFWLRPATPGWVVGVCVFVCVLPLYPATPGWCVLRGCVCLGSGFGCAPPLLAGMLGCVCAGVHAPLVPRHSWLGVRRGCVCLDSGFHCAPPLLAGVLGCVCAGVCAPPVPCHSWLGFVVCGLAVSSHLFLCRGSLRVVRAARVCGTRWPLLLGTFSCALVVACSVPLWRASWPRVGAPHLVRSGCSQCTGQLFCRRGAFPPPGGLPGFTWWLRGARGGRPRTGLIVPAAGARRGRGAGLVPHCTRSGPRDGVVGGGSLRRWSWAACAAVFCVCGPGH